MFFSTLPGEAVEVGRECQQPILASAVLLFHSMVLTCFSGLKATHLLPPLMVGLITKRERAFPPRSSQKSFAGHGAWDQACQDVLGLSRMNWNNDYLYDRLPVTMAYAQVLAQVIKRMPSVLPNPYQFRLFM